jgi:hypothetical protein
MSAFYNITRTLAQVLQDIELGIPIVMENQEFEPPDAGQWAAMFMLPIPNTSMGKGHIVWKDADENSGIMQISLFDSDSGNLAAALYILADKIGSSFIHGVEYSFPQFGDEVVYIDNVSRDAGRNQGGFFQMDISVNWISYIQREFRLGNAFSDAFGDDFG